jgi:hypothetical protein
MNRVEHVVAQLHGEESLEAYASRAGIDARELREWKALYLAGGASAFAPRSSKKWLAAAVVAFALIPASVFAVGTCTQTLPYPLVTFCPDSPAVAQEMNGNFAALAKAVIDRTGAPLDGGANIVQTNTGRLLSSDNVVRLGGNAATVQLQLDTNSAGSGAALFVDSSDTLFLNRGSAFSGGTTIEGSAKVNANLTASTLITNSIQPTGGSINVGSSTNTTNLAVWGELQANSLRARNCTWRGGANVGLNTATGAICNAGEYAAGVSCSVPSGYYLSCATYCCLP